MKMPRITPDPRTFGHDEADCLRLLELLADGDPLPDTSAICPERQPLIALLVEISKGERSELRSHIAAVAERRGLSAQEIASRAGFLLACLDTPGEDDAYATLGVSATATREEIRAAWLRRLSLYHPDRHQGNRDSDWFTRQAARLNDAYQTLKDPARRRAYDERRQRLMLVRQRGSSAPQSTSLLPPMPSPPSRLMRHQLPPLITGGAVAAAGVMAMTLFLARPAHQSPSTRLRAGLDGPHTMLGVTSLAPPHTLRPSAEGPASGGGMPGEPPVASILKPERERERAAGRPLHKTTAMREAGRQMVAQALPPIIPEPKGLDRQEIDTLLDEYIDAYEKADVERVMATLSTRVREKGTMDYQAIRNLYAKGFAGREQIIYRLKNIQVEIKGEQALVAAQYLISAKNAAQSSKGTTVSGRIEWRIQREGDKLKIVSINY